MTNAPRFNHAYTLGFEVISHHAHGDDVGAGEIRRAIIAKLAASSDIELMENAGTPFDTYRIDEPSPIKCGACS